MKEARSVPEKAHNSTTRWLRSSDQKAEKRFQRVLMAQDIDSVNLGLLAALKEAFGFRIDHATSADNAFLRVKQALADKEPYDLLIACQPFESPRGNQHLHSAKDLFRAARLLQPGLKTLLYTTENRPYKIRECLQDCGINGYAQRTGDGGMELIEAIRALSRQGCYISPQVSESIADSLLLKIDSYDVLLLGELAKGYSHREISRRFSVRGISPRSLSSIEKRINQLKEYFRARNTPHLIALVKDEGLI